MSSDVGEEGPQLQSSDKPSPRKSKSSPAVSASAVARTTPSSLGSGSKKRTKRTKALSESELSPLVTGKMSPGTPMEFGQPHLTAAESDNEELLFPSSAPQMGQFVESTETRV